MNNDINDTDQPDTDRPQDMSRGTSSDNQPQMDSNLKTEDQIAGIRSPYQSGLPIVEPAETKAQVMPNTPVLIVLQWLTYAFWGWTILAVIWLGYIVLANMLTGMDLTDVIPYAIASTLVLLPLSFVVDAFYGRKETSKKTGPAIVVMVIHAVIFALCGIGTLISAVFVVIQLAIGETSDNGIPMSILLTLFLSTALYAVTFFRTLNPLPKVPVARFYKYIMAGIIGVLVVMAFVGPVAKSVQTRNDREIVDGISYVERAIGEYVERNGDLPKSLNDLSFENKGKVIVDKGLVTYKPEGKVNLQTEFMQRSTPTTSELSDNLDVAYRYQLCVTYKEAKMSNGSYGYSRPQNEYEEFLSIYDHPAGEVCYKLQTTVYADTFR